MSKVDVILKLSQEGREWAKMLLPVLFSLMTGHLHATAKYMRKDGQ